MLWKRQTRLARCPHVAPTTSVSLSEILATISKEFKSRMYNARCPRRPTQCPKGSAATFATLFPLLTRLHFLILPSALRQQSLSHIEPHVSSALMSPEEPCACVTTTLSSMFLQCALIFAFSISNSRCCNC